MTSSFVLYLILTGIIGFHCRKTTVKKVSIKDGGSISVPCLYEQCYRKNKKYLCRGDKWKTCKKAVITNKPDNTGKFSISDDKDHMIFTVTFNNVTDTTDDELNRCGVDKRGKKYTSPKFKLSVTPDLPSLYVDRQEIKAYEGGNVTILCHYRDVKVTKWCQLGSPCLVNEKQRLIRGTLVTINDTIPGVFSVTMSGLKSDSSGWYWCCNKDLQMPVHITVLKVITTTPPTTTTPTTTSTTTTTSKTTVSISTAGTFPATSQLSSTLATGEQNTSSTTSGEFGKGSQNKRQSSTEMVILIVTLILLLFLAFSVFVGWRVIRLNRTKSETPKTPGESQTGSDPNLFYATISHKKREADQEKQSPMPEVSVIYSNVVRKDPEQQMTEPADGGVIYSTVQATRK